MMFGLLIVLLALVGALFSGVQAGLRCVDRVRLRNRVKHHDRRAVRLQRLLRHPLRMRLTTAFLAGLAHIAVLALVTSMLVGAWGVWGYVFAFLGFAPLYFCGLDMLPKAIFRRLPIDALLWLSAPLRWVYLALAPLFRLGEGCARSFFPPVPGEKFADARDKFKQIMLESEHSGAITASQRRLIHGVVDFRSVTARELMQPLADFPTVNDARLFDGREHFLLKAEGEIAVVSLFEALMSGTSPRPLVFITVAAEEAAFQVLAKLRASRCSLAVVTEGEGPVGLLLIRPLYRRLLAGTEQG